MKATAILLYMLILSTLGYSQTYNGSILRIIDGDTFVFQTTDGSFIVRMQGIDAPEKGQPYSKESADFLKSYLDNDATFIRQGMDRYGRTIGILIINGLDINLLSIKEGFSWHFKKYSTNQKYANAEDYARRNKFGLWKLDGSVPPWDWRKMSALKAEI